jgi:hypothetical protein
MFKTRRRKLIAAGLGVLALAVAAVLAAVPTIAGGLLLFAAVALVLTSWIFLALVRLVHATGRRPLARPGVRTAATAAVFVAVLGAVLTVWIVVYFFDSMRHFDDGIPAGDQVLLDAAGWGSLAVGSVLGTLAAMRVRRQSPS